MTPPDDVRKESWHLSKSVPISLVFALALQLAGFVWFMAQMDGRIGANTDEINRNGRDISRLRTEVDGLTSIARDQAVQLGRIEENITAVLKAIEGLDRKLR